MAEINYKEALQKLESVKEELEGAVFEEVERLARNVLSLNKNKVTEFVMAMGTFFFTDKKGEVMYDWVAEKLKGYKELNDFICDWNEDFKITGYPMRFTEKGILINNW